MILGAYLDEFESLDREYKEFCLKCEWCKYIKKKDIYNILREGTLPLKFNDMILSNIRLYIQNYFSKYACCFHNASNQESNFDRMSFYIGINDYGEITGIPFNGKLSEYECMIRKWADETFNMNMKDMCCVDYKIIIEECKIDNCLLDDENLTKLLEEYDRYKDVYEQNYLNYVLRKKQWIEDIQKYKGKIKNVFTESELKEEFIEYMKEQSLYDKFIDEFHEICNNKNEDITNTQINDIRIYKKDTTNLLYWIIQFKEKNTDYLRENKPHSPVSPKILNMDICALIQLSCLRKRLLSKNKYIKYHVIILEFSRIKCSNIISYFDKKRSKYRYIFRTLKNNSPRNDVVNN